jgi:hypothetical protein
MLFTDPIVVTGLLSTEEFTIRSSTGIVEFSPPNVNERLIREAGFDLLWSLDVTDDEVDVSRRWHDSRLRHTVELLRWEGNEAFARLQQLLRTAHRLAIERRLSRFAYLAQT